MGAGQSNIIDQHADILKQTKNNYEVIFPLTYETNGLFRYFLINESDRDKINVGSYLIFKSDAGGPLYSNKRYKILEVKVPNLDEYRAFLSILKETDTLYKYPRKYAKILKIPLVG